MANGMNGNGLYVPQAIVAPTSQVQRRRRPIFAGLPFVQIFINGGGSTSLIMKVRVPERSAFYLFTGMVPIMRFFRSDGKEISHESRLAWGLLGSEEDMLPRELAQADYAMWHGMPVSEQRKSQNQEALAITVRNQVGQPVGAIKATEGQFLTVWLEAPEGDEIDWDHPDTDFRWEVIEERLSYA